MKKLLSILLICAFLLAGCGKPRRYSASCFDLFDTVTTVTGSAGSEAAFQKQAEEIFEKLRHYHRLFDIYNSYEGVNNLHTVNAQAGIAPVTVDRAIIELLLSCREYYTLTDEKVNVAMGSLLRLWHEARQTGVLPSQEALSRAAEHGDWRNVVIDEAASTVFITDPEQSLDVGAVAKGWACQRVSLEAPKGLLISVGGNVVATGPKEEDGTPWRIGVQDPEGGEAYLQTLSLSSGAVVTSGDYQRTVTIDGRAYHHIIDPHTRMPATLWRSVTVVCPDSGLADALSTALFLLPLEEGRALAQRCGAQALWVDGEGNQFQ